MTWGPEQEEESGQTMLNTVFFDRDGTLLHRDPALRAKATELIRGWGGADFRWPSHEESMALFDRAEFPAQGNKTVEEEQGFWRRYYREMLRLAGVIEDTEERAETIFQLMWPGNPILYPETRKVLEWFKAKGFRMGVISDTGPSLPLTLEKAGIGDYFRTCTASEVVGAMKPEPAIFRAALEAMGAKAEECLYVDDTQAEADGARALGFTAFYLDRSRPGDGRWRIQTLDELVAYAEKLG